MVNPMQTLDRPVLLLSGGVQYIEKTCLAVDHHLFPIRVLYSRVVFINKAVDQTKAVNTRSGGSACVILTDSESIV